MNCRSDAELLVVKCRLLFPFEGNKTRVNCNTQKATVLSDVSFVVYFYINEIINYRMMMDLQQIQWHLQ